MSRLVKEDMRAAESTGDLSMVAIRTMGGLMDVNNHHDGTVKKFPCMLRTFAD
jgi:hypothetical protein